jgi:hypothetical protein
MISLGRDPAADQHPTPASSLGLMGQHILQSATGKQACGTITFWLGDFHRSATIQAQAPWARHASTSALPQPPAAQDLRVPGSHDHWLPQWPGYFRERHSKSHLPEQVCIVTSQTPLSSNNSCCFLSPEKSQAPVRVKAYSSSDFVPKKYVVT